MGKRLVNIHMLHSLGRLMYGYPFQKEKIALLQLKKLLSHAYENFEFYRQRMDACGFNPYKVNDLSELEQLPVLTKEEYRSFTKDLLNRTPDKYKNYYFDRTSGSTGIPLEIVRS